MLLTYVTDSEYLRNEILQKLFFYRRILCTLFSARQEHTWKPKDCLSQLDKGEGLADCITRILTRSSLIQRRSCSRTYKREQKRKGYYSQLSLLTDTSTRRTPGVCPCAPFFCHFAVSKLSISRTHL